jgi:hypothetical protein
MRGKTGLGVMIPAPHPKLSDLFRWLLRAKGVLIGHAARVRRDRNQEADGDGMALAGKERRRQGPAA